MKIVSYSFQKRVIKCRECYSYIIQYQKTAIHCQKLVVNYQNCIIKCQVCVTVILCHNCLLSESVLSNIESILLDIKNASYIYKYIYIWIAKNNWKLFGFRSHSRAQASFQRYLEIQRLYIYY